MNSNGNVIQIKTGVIAQHVMVKYVKYKEDLNHNNADLLKIIKDVHV